MKYFQLDRINKLYFGYEEVAKVLGINVNSAKVSVSRYVKQGILIRIKRNFYVLREKWNSLENDEKFVLANLGQVPSYISLITALAYYGISTQMQPGFIESIAIKRSKIIELQGLALNYTKIRKKLYFDFYKNGDFFIATPEKAFLDAVYLLSLKRYTFDRTAIDIDKLDKQKINVLLKKFPERTRKTVKKNGYFKKA